MEESPDFSRLCHLTKIHFSCSHQLSVKKPRVIHVDSCNFEHVDRDDHRCFNMAPCPEVVSVFAYCPDCSNRPATPSQSDRKVEIITESTGIKPEPTEAEKSDDNQLRHNGDEDDIDDWETVKEFLEMRRKTADEKLSITKPGTLTSEPEKFSGTSSEGSNLDTEKRTDSREGSYREGGWIDVRRRHGPDSWVFVDVNPVIDLTDRDQGLLVQRQKNGRLPVARWLINMLCGE